jgi:putative transposase
MSFEFFDPQDGVAIHQGNLPHWYQPGVTYFITFRTEDFVPQPLLSSWHRRRNEWLHFHGIDPLKKDWHNRVAQSEKLHGEYQATFTREFMDYLDRSYGECVLRERKAAELVANSLHFFDGSRYTLGDFVIVPNHVHVLVCLLNGTNMERQCRSWKTYSANEINALLGRTGRFWQEESFDHLVRSTDQFERLQWYIAANPHKANLKSGDYLHWTQIKR